MNTVLTVIFILSTALILLVAVGIYTVKRADEKAKQRFKISQSRRNSTAFLDTLVEDRR